MMASSILRSLAGLLLLLVVPLSGAAAQLPVSIGVEARVGMAIPNGEVADDGDDFSAEVGPRIAGAVTLFPIDEFALFLGYQQSRFGCAVCEATGLEGRVVASGPEAGLHVELPLGRLGLGGWLRGGVRRQTLTFAGYGDEMSLDPAAGVIAAGGLSIPIAARVLLLPGLHYYSSVGGDFAFTELPPRSVELSTAVVDLGLAIRF